MGTFHFDGLFLHDDEALAFIRKFAESDDADARYVAQRLIDTCPQLATDGENLFVVNPAATVHKFPANA